MNEANLNYIVNFIFQLFDQTGTGTQTIEEYRVAIYSQT